jgi:phenylalanyl-tRNA synthetase beta chain
MRVSYNWLQTHYKEKLPAPEAIASALIFHSFEVEGVEKDNNGDDFLEVKILPDRAHDCLCHLGISREISALFGLPAPVSIINKLGDKGISHSGPTITVENSELCRRYVGRVVRNIKVRTSPEKIKKLLEGIGQRSINNIVDSANFVMFEMGQPLHAFDLDKIVGNITIRKAKTGEKIQTLDDKEIDLSEEVLIIADDVGPLAIAGVKGGKRAGVTETTRNIFLESANFDPVSVRRTATKLSLRTDASKRFENDYSRELAEEAIMLFSGLLLEMASEGDTVFEDLCDVYPTKMEGGEVVFTAEQIGAILGVKLSNEEILKLLSKTGSDVLVDGDKIRATPPKWRLDLSILPDFAEEVGRLYGYDKIPNVLPPKFDRVESNKEYELSNKIKEVLLNLGLSEIYGYSLTDEGGVEIDNPLASDKAFLRSNLSRQMEENIALNLRNNLFDQDPVSIFEIGNVFAVGGEERRLCIGIGYKTKKLNKSKAELSAVVSKIFETLNITKEPRYDLLEKETLSILEIPLKNILKYYSGKEASFMDLVNKTASYKKISHYPRSVRDIALFVPPEIQPEYVADILKKSAGELLVMEPVLFDIFEKKDESGKPVKKSLAFRLVFQSHEKTLNEEDITAEMTQVLDAIKKEKDWEVR